MSEVAWYDDDEGFASELARGRATEMLVASMLLGRGLWVRVEEFFFRESIAENPRYREQRDIEVGGGHLIEVKSRGLRFTSPEDYPYPTADVGSRRRWDARTDLPCSIVLYSEPTGSLLVAPLDSRPHWTTREAYDHRRHFTEVSYSVPVERLLPFDALLTHVRGPCSRQTSVSG